MEGAIASGGMASVYAAHDTLLDRPVAVKVLAEHLNEDIAARERFQREARAAAGLSGHPAVVTIFDVGEHDGRSFIVMERRTGGTVGDALKRQGRIEPDRAIGWLRDIADALDAAHERGVVHRDIKPPNLLLDPHDRVAVADFGIARIAWEEQVTQTGQVLGTAAYLSPEQAAGEPATAASDRYALTVVAYELLTGQRPFAGEHFAAQARAHIEDAPPSAPGLPPAAQDVLARGMAKDAGGRWPSARGLVEALAAGLDERAPAPVPVATEATRAMSPMAPRPTSPSAPRPRPSSAPRPTPPTDRPRRSRAAVALAALAGVALVIAAVAIAASTGGDDPVTQAGTPERERQATRTRTPAAEPTADAPATATATPASTAASTAVAESGDPSALNDEGFELSDAGEYAAAVPILQRAVAACEGNTSVDPCAYATYNLGVALNRSGQPAEAIEVLQAELERWPDNQPETVTAELSDACDNAGQDCGLSQGNGKAKGKVKD